jgi:hypothetical protein
MPRPILSIGTSQSQSTGSTSAQFALSRRAGEEKSKAPRRIERHTHKEQI